MANTRFPYPEPDNSRPPYYPPDRSSGRPVACSPIPALTISEVERLAKAGVTIPESMLDRIIPDEIQAPKYDRLTFDHDTIRPLIDRWQIAHPTNDMFVIDPFPFKVAAQRHGDKMYVFVYPRNEPPMILEDAAHLYPSDALMAKLHLYQETHKHSHSADQG